MSDYTEADRAEATRRQLEHGWAVLAQAEKILLMADEHVGESSTYGLGRAMSERLGISAPTVYRRLRIVREEPHMDKTRFFAKTTERSGCWEWGGARNRAGYGRARVFGRVMLTHRAAWMFEHGEIPRGMFVCHRCDNPPCVNPAHLFVGTASDNVRDMVSKGHGWIGKHLSAEHRAKIAPQKGRPRAIPATHERITRAKENLRRMEALLSGFASRRPLSETAKELGIDTEEGLALLRELGVRRVSVAFACPG